MSDQDTPKQHPLLTEHTTLDALFPGYREWIRTQHRYKYPPSVHPAERSLYDAWHAAVSSPPPAKREQEGE